MRGDINVGLPNALLYVSHRCVDTCVLFIYCHFSHATHFPHCKQPVIKSLPWHPSQDERPRNGQRHLHIICKNVSVSASVSLASCVRIYYVAFTYADQLALECFQLPARRVGNSSSPLCIFCVYLWDTLAVHSLIKVIIFLMFAPSAFCPVFV